MSFGIKEAELQRLLDTYIIEEGGSASLQNIKEGIRRIIQENNAAIQKEIEALIKKQQS